MIIVGEKKYACESCIKGHRSSGCKHNDRPLFEVKRKGRPITQCEHCRELRKTKQVHVKCMCEGTPNASTTKTSSASSLGEEASSFSSTSSLSVAPSVGSSGKKRVKKSLPEAAFPAGLPSETIEASAALQILSEGGYSSEDMNGHTCSCKNTNECNCWSHRSRPVKMTSSSSSNSLPLDIHSKPVQPHYRTVLPRPPNRRRTSDASISSLSTGPIHDPNEDHPRAHGQHGRRSSFYSPYGRAYEYAGLTAQSQDAFPPPPPSTCSESSVDDQLSLPSHHSNQSRDFDFDFRYTAPPSGYTDAPTQSYRGESQLDAISNGGGRVQPHHEAPFAPPQTPTDVPFPSWPVTLSPFSQRDPRSFAAIEIGARAPMDVDGSRSSSLPPSIGRANASQARSELDAEVGAMLDLPLCGCGDSCACPGCVEHASAQITANAYDLCTNPPACAMCLQCSILALPEPDLGIPSGHPSGDGQNDPPGVPRDTQGMSMGMMGGMMDIDEWLRSVAPHDESASGYAYATSVHSADYANSGYTFGEDAPPAPASDRADGEFYDVVFDPSLLATWDPPPDPNGDMTILPELFLPEMPPPGQPYPPEYGNGSYDLTRLTTFATSGARHDEDTPSRPELLVVPPTPAMRAGSGLGLSRADTLDAEAENARYLAAHLAALSNGGAPSPDSSGGGSSPHSDVASSGSGPRRNSTTHGHVQGTSLSSSDSSSLGSSVLSGTSLGQLSTQRARTQSGSKFKLFGAMPGIFGGNRGRFS